MINRKKKIGFLSIRVCCFDFCLGLSAPGSGIRVWLYCYIRTGSAPGKKSYRAISTTRLRMLPLLHLSPINVVVFDDPQWMTHL